jgi:hypothetical protein
MAQHEVISDQLNNSVGFKVVTPVVMKGWGITTCSPLKFNRCFGRTCLLHLQSRIIGQETNQLEAGSKQSKMEATCFPETSQGRNIAQAVSCWLATAPSRIRARVWQVGSVVDKVVLRQVYSKYFGFPCQSSFHKFSIIIITRGRYNTPFRGRRAEWTQYELHPSLCELKKKLILRNVG